MASPSDRDVVLKLSEIQKLRDDLAKLRDHAPMIRQLWLRVAALYVRVSKQETAEQETLR